MPRLLRAWFSIHETRSAVLLFTLAMVLALSFTHIYIDSFVVDLSIPVPVILLIPAIASAGIGIGIGSSARTVEAARPLRLVLARTVWAMGPLLIISLSFNMIIAGENAAAATRNFLFLSSVSMIAAVVISTTWAWMPVTAISMTSLFFGQLDGRIQPWAFVVDQRVTSGQLFVTAVLVTLAILLYGLRGARSG